MSIRQSLGITTASQAASFVLSLGSIMVISRLLTPAEVGVYSVAMALVTFAHLLRDFGVGNYLIQVPEVTPARLRAAFTMMLATSWLVALVMFLVREPAAVFYRDPGVAEVVGLLSLNFVLLPFGAPLLTLLRRDLRFGWIATVNLSSQAVHALVTILTAMAGESYLSLAWGSLAGVVTTILMLIAISPRQAFLLPTLRGLREVLQFSTQAFATSVVSEMSVRGPDLIYGRTLGVEAVAFYSRAQGVLNLAVNQLVNTAYGVFMPAFAKATREGGDAGEVYTRAMTLLTGITMPVAAVMGVMAEPTIDLLFGDQWGRAAPLTTLLCAYHLFRAPFLLTMAALTATGQVGLALRAELVMMIASIAIMLTSVWLSLEQVVLAMSLWVAFAGVIDSWALRKAFGLRFGALWSGVGRSLLLVPPSVVGPWLLVETANLGPWTWGSFVLVVTGGVLAGAGWLAVVFRSGHPLADEIRLAWRTLRTVGQ